jgi:hypothetical protein
VKTQSVVCFNIAKIELEMAKSKCRSAEAVMNKNWEDAEKANTAYQLQKKELVLEKELQEKLWPTSNK